MKRSGILLFILLFVTFVSGQTINIGQQRLQINDVNASDTWVLGEFKKALGEPDRSVMDYNRTLIYDEKGIVLQEYMRNKKPVDTVASFVIHFMIPTPKSGLPDSVFSGTATILKLELSKTTSYAHLKKGLKGWDELQPNTFTKHTHVYTDGKVYVHFWFANEAETELRMMSVSWHY